MKHTTRYEQKTGRRDGQLDISKGKTVAFATGAVDSMKNYYAILEEIEAEEIETSKELFNTFTEYHNVGA